MITMYGIPNCDTIKKARRWLEANAINYEFHDYKKSGVPEKDLNQWIKQIGWETLLNRRGTTWRKLDDATKKNINEASAIKVILDNPSIIKRPVLVNGKTILIGFNEAEYKKIFRQLIISPGCVTDQ
ncbi:MAG: ArsC family reductase [Gammaproteobacteria bacterium]|nr:ArsC family reductase [Gammaproteobacteria bacterium]